MTLDAQLKIAHETGNSKNKKHHAIGCKCTIFTHPARVFPHKIDSGNPITTFSVSSLHIIVATTEVKVFPRPFPSATSAPGIAASQTQFLTMNHMAQSWCARNFVLGRPGIEYVWPGTPSFVDWQIRWAFSSLTASSRHWGPNWLLVVLRTVLNNELVLSGSRTSSPSPCSWTSVVPWSVFFSFSIMSFSRSEVSWGDGLILRRSRHSSRCYVFHKQALGPNTYVEYNQFYSLNPNLQ